MASFLELLLTDVRIAVCQRWVTIPFGAAWEETLAMGPEELRDEDGIVVEIKEVHNIVEGMLPYVFFHEGKPAEDTVPAREFMALPFCCADGLHLPPTQLDETCGHNSPELDAEANAVDLAATTILTSTLEHIAGRFPRQLGSPPEVLRPKGCMQFFDKDPLLAAELSSV